MATVTDPYQPVERTAKVTRRILEAMVERQPRVKLVIQTRSTLVTRDIPLLLELVERGGRVQVNMTVSTGDDGVRKLYEPGCSSIEARLKATQAIHDGGLQACVTMTPMLPMRDAAGFAGRLLETGIRQFICQPFRHPGQDRGENIARTDQRAMAHFGVDTAEEAVRRYNEGYRRDLQALKEVLLREKGVVLGQDRAGFRPPF
jgi:DNA repair photolyase